MQAYKHTISTKLLLGIGLLFVSLVHCIDGPDVIKGKRGNDILIDACWSKVLLEHRASWARFSKEAPFLSSIFVSTYCAREVMHPRKLYLKDAVDYCRANIVNIQATNYIEFIAQVPYITEKVCDLQPVSFWDFQEPFQGELIDLNPPKGDDGPSDETKRKDLLTCAFMLANGWDPNSGLWFLQCLRAAK